MQYDKTRPNECIAYENLEIFKFTFMNLDLLLRKALLANLSIKFPQQCIPKTSKPKMKATRLTSSPEDGRVLRRTSEIHSRDSGIEVLSWEELCRRKNTAIHLLSDIQTQLGSFVIYPVIGDSISDEDARQYLHTWCQGEISKNQRVLCNDGDLYEVQEIHFVVDTVTSRTELITICEKCTHILILIKSDPSITHTIVTSHSMKQALNNYKY